MRALFFVTAVILAAAPAVAHADDDSLYSCHKPAAGSKLRISLKPDSTLQDVVLWATGFTCKNFIFADTGVSRQRLTIVAPNEMTAAQAYKLFLAALSAHDLVAVEKDNTVVIKDAPGAAKRCPPPSPETASGSSPVPAQPIAVPAPAAEAEPDPILDAGVKKIDDTHYTVTRAARERMIEIGPITARVVPWIIGGTAQGMKFYAIRPGSAYARLGLQNGDGVRAVNNIPFAVSLEDALKQLLTAEVVKVSVYRRGSSLTIEVRVVP